MKCFHKNRAKSNPTINAIVLAVFLFGQIFTPSLTFAQSTVLSLPTPGAMVKVSPSYVPLAIQGLKIYPENPFRFDFILDTGNSNFEGESLKAESGLLIKYFLAALTVPDDDQWVNLSPYEKDRIIPNEFGRTEMGRDLLAQDYLLKQLSSSLTAPDEEMGKRYWEQVRELTSKTVRSLGESGTQSPSTSILNKIWIMPDRARVYESGNVAFITESRLKVMLKEDYIAERESQRQKDKTSEDQPDAGLLKSGDRPTRSIVRPDSSTEPGTRILREIILPRIEKEVNEGKNFAKLRQIYHAMIMAAWFKRKLMKSILGQAYVGKNKVAGVEYTRSVIAGNPEGTMKQSLNDKVLIYQHYLEAFKKGVYHFIREEEDPVTDEMVPRKYFAGGFTGGQEVASSTIFEGTTPDHLSDLASDVLKGRYLTASSHFEPMRAGKPLLAGSPLAKEQMTASAATMEPPRIASSASVTEMGKLGKKIPGLVQEVLSAQSMDAATDFNGYRPEQMDSFISGFLERFRSGDQVTPKVFERIVRRFLTLDQIREYGPQFRTLDMVTALQKIHTISTQLSLFGIREESLGSDAFRLSSFLKQLPYSYAQLLAIAEGAGLAGPRWDTIVPNPRVIQAARSGNFSGVMGSLTPGKTINELLPELKAIFSILDIDILDMENDFLKSLSRQFSGQLTDPQTYDQTIKTMSDYFKNAVIDDVLSALGVIYLINDKYPGWRITKLLGRGRDGLAILAKNPSGEDLVLKANVMPTADDENFLKNQLPKTSDRTKGNPAFVAQRGIEVFEKHVTDITGKTITQAIIVEINSFVPGQSMRAIISQPGITSNQLLDLLQQFIRMLAALYQKGSLNIDINLENILVTDSGLAVQVDFANIADRDDLAQYKSTEEKYAGKGADEILANLEGEYKLDITRAVARILTGQYNKDFNAGDIDELAALMHGRVTEDKIEAAKDLLLDLIKAAKDPSVGGAEFFHRADQKLPALRSSSAAVPGKNPHIKMGDTGSSLDARDKTSRPQDVGGIDMNQKALDLQTDGETIKSGPSLDPAQLENLEFDGITPVILQVVPANLPLFMGVKKT